MQKQTSTFEQAYIQLGCEQGIRGDGRGHDDFRSIVIENSIFPHVNGSSRVRIPGIVDVLCSIKVEVTEPKADKPDHGLLDVNVDISPACSSLNDEKDLQNYSAKIADVLNRSLRGCKSFPWKELCIIPGKFCFNLQIDILIMQIDGNPLDVCSIAIYVALQTTLVPKTLPKTSAGVAATKEYTSFDVVGNIEDAIPIDFQRIPIVISVVQVGKSFILDATQAEEDSCSNIMAVGITKDLDCSSIQVIKGGALSTAGIPIIFKKSCDAAAGIFAYLEKYLQSIAMSEEDLMFPDVPPVRLGLLA